MEKLIVTSTAFEHNQGIPDKYTCKGEEVNPPLAIRNVPLRTESLALIMSDPDAAGGTWSHWLVWNINPNGSKIRENSVPGLEGKNSADKIGYQGPCPPSGTHRYIFRVYALNSKLDLKSGAARRELAKAMKGKVIATGSLIGTYKKSGKHKNKR